MLNQSTLILLFSLVFGLTVSLAGAQEPLTSPTGEVATSLGNEHDKHALIIYLSRTNNTEAVAQMIHEEVGGRMVKLELETPYPEDYTAIVAQVDNENKTGYLPPLKTHVANFEDYEVVFIGFPTWDMQLPPPMKSFLNEYDLSGKTLIPFNTNGGYGVGRSFEDVNRLASDAEILPGFTVKGGLEKEGVFLSIKGERQREIRGEVREWLRRIGIL